ncbi:MAG: P-type conjugative transfer protein TrbJ [Novosphingobium sp.]|nr:P-type conjugative transfer protein TrbJ [uncultured Roseateles sp.]
MKKSRIPFAAKAAALATAVLLSTAPVQAGIPVIDGTNLSQNIMTALESVAQTLKQIEQYSTQLQQYENQLQNTVAPAAYIWDQAQNTITNLQRATDTLNYYKTQLGSLDNYLAKFQDVSYYRASSCFQRAGCTADQRAALDANSVTTSQALKKAHDAMFQGIDQQQSNLNNDAAQLQRLQAQAQGATGQMAAIGFANQLASNQANQLLQIRALLIAQQNALATRANADADKEAQRSAASKALRNGTLSRGTDTGVRAW